MHNKTAMLLADGISKKDNCDMLLSACLEWLFTEEATNFTDRFIRAKAAGVKAVEFWRWSNKDIHSIRSVLSDTGLSLCCFLAEPTVDLSNKTQSQQFLAGLETSIQTAEFLGSPLLILQTGNFLTGVSAAEQRRQVVSNLGEAARLAEQSSVRLAVEPLNTLIDHPGYYLHSTSTALEIITEIASPKLGLLYDLYHSTVMGEKIDTVLAGSVDKVFHVHISDAPGRGEPGTGQIDFISRLGWLDRQGYLGAIGLECRPSGGSIQAISAALRVLSGVYAQGGPSGEGTL